MVKTFILDTGFCFSIFVPISLNLMPIIQPINNIYLIS